MMIVTLAFCNKGVHRSHNICISLKNLKGTWYKIINISLFTTSTMLFLYFFPLKEQPLFASPPPILITNFEHLSPPPLLSSVQTAETWASSSSKKPKGTLENWVSTKVLINPKYTDPLCSKLFSSRSGEHYCLCIRDWTRLYFVTYSPSSGRRSFRILSRDVVLPILALGILGSDDDDDDSELLVAGFFGGGAAGSAAATAAPAPLRRPGRLVTELLSAERLILLALSELDLSWPPPLADLMCLLEGPIGGVGLQCSTRLHAMQALCA